MTEEERKLAEAVKEELLNKQALLEDKKRKEGCEETLPAKRRRSKSKKLNIFHSLETGEETLSDPKPQKAIIKISKQIMEQISLRKAEKTFDKQESPVKTIEEPQINKVDSSALTKISNRLNEAMQLLNKAQSTILELQIEISVMKESNL